MLRSHAPSRTGTAVLLLAIASLLLTAVGVAPATATEQFSFEGRGNGHGIGMSQYGAQVQAREGRTHEQILATYYQGTGLTSRSAPFPARIGVVLDQPRVQLIVRGANAKITVGNIQKTGKPGQVWEVSMLSSGQCRVTHGDGSPRTDWYGSANLCLVADPDSGGRIEVRRPSGSKMVTHHQYGRSAVVEVFRDSVNGTWLTDTVVEVPLEEYLYGLAEMPYSWDAAALRTQAIAGRSYALHRLLSIGTDSPDRGCSCHLYDSQQDQVYKGWDREQTEKWSRWRDAVNGTAGVVVHAPGQIGTRDGVVQAFYSSSSNGRTEAKHELWGGSPFPYLSSVKDPWSTTSFNPHRSWAAQVGQKTVAAKLGWDHVSTMSVVARSTSGAATSVRFQGRNGGKDVSATRTGSWVRTAFGLRSTTIDRIFLPPFIDDDGHRFEADIAWLAASGITSGCNSANDRFCPDRDVTRGQMAAFLTRALNLPAGTATFSDTRGHRFEADIAAIARAGITTGCNSGGTKFCPDTPISRGQMAAFLTRALNLPNGTATFSDTRGHRFEADIAAIARAGITTGCNSGGTKFCPETPVSRGQMAAFLHRSPL